MNDFDTLRNSITRTLLITREVSTLGDLRALLAECGLPDDVAIGYVDISGPGYEVSLSVKTLGEISEVEIS